MKVLNKPDPAKLLNSKLPQLELTTGHNPPQINTHHRVQSQAQLSLLEGLPAEMWEHAFSLGDPLTLLTAL